MPFAVTSRRGTVCERKLQHPLAFCKFGYHEILNPLGRLHAFSLRKPLHRKEMVGQQQNCNAHPSPMKVSHYGAPPWA